MSVAPDVAPECAPRPRFPPGVVLAASAVVVVAGQGSDRLDRGGGGAGVLAAASLQALPAPPPVGSDLAMTDTCSEPNDSVGGGCRLVGAGAGRMVRRAATGISSDMLGAAMVRCARRARGCAWRMLQLRWWCKVAAPPKRHTGRTMREAIFYTSLRVSRNVARATVGWQMLGYSCGCGCGRAGASFACRRDAARGGAPFTCNCTCVHCVTGSLMNAPPTAGLSAVA